MQRHSSNSMNRQNQVMNCGLHGNITPSIAVFPSHELVCGFEISDLHIRAIPFEVDVPAGVFEIEAA